MGEREAIVDWVLNIYQGRTKGYVPYVINDHLVSCTETYVKFDDAYDGTYGCDTGCEYYRVDGYILCSHGESQRFDFGDFGELMDDVPGIDRRIVWDEIEE